MIAFKRLLRPKSAQDRWGYSVWLGSLLLVTSAQADRLDTDLSSASALNYDQVKPILEKRCIVCHGCYDAPCQLKLSSYTGTERGGSKEKVYDGERIHAAQPTRLFMDAQTIEQWRTKGFYSLIGDADDGGASVLTRMLKLKDAHPQPVNGRLPENYTLGLNRDDVCPKEDEFDQFAQDHPNWGMPYAMPNLPPKEYATLLNWAKHGAPGQLEDLDEVVLSEQAAFYEKYLNIDTFKHQLMGRYVYEHLFLAHIHFADNSPRTFYKLVRSKTPPGEPIEVIHTTRPYDDPGVERVFYRLRAVEESIVDKDHLVYYADANTYKKYQAWFIFPDYDIQKLPGYDPKESANPFKIYADMPAIGRYRFLLEQAQFIIEGFIKGPVCRGQVALNVIEEQFWVMFFDPDHDIISNDTAFLAQQADNLALPTADGVQTFRLLAAQTTYQNKQRLYLDAKQKLLLSKRNIENRQGLNLIWDGEGTNRNALLTVFRNQDSATVLKGLHGKIPKTAWVIDYPLLERIQYLLVSGFDVYGNVGHQLNTRLYMDFLRMEGENNFLGFLPEDTREKLRHYWYRNTSDEIIQSDLPPMKTAIHYQTKHPKNEFFQRVVQKEEFRQILNTDPINRPHMPFKDGDLDVKVQTFLQRLADLNGKGVDHWPEVSFMRIRHFDGRETWYTLYLNRGYYNVSSVFFDQYNRVPKENTVTVIQGLHTSYPGMFFDVPEVDLDVFLALAKRVEHKKDVQRWVAAYGVRRTDPKFWEFADDMLFYQQQQQPVRWGIFDLNRYLNH
ncbi:MAG: fatty acid cis/trans isomerase [Hydrogenovibrio sp.]